MKKERADVLCVLQNLFDSREKAKRAIMAGTVYIGDTKVDKAGEKYKNTTIFNVKGSILPYVSRGGFKLEKAIKLFSFSVENKVMLDIGASTGGFTDCALQNGAKYVYALDVGTNQLAWKLRINDKVCVMEKTNFRHCTKSLFSKKIEVVSIDVSFISLTIILEKLTEIIEENGDVCALIKPQFEAGKINVSKGGIVKSKKVHEDVIKKIFEFANSKGFSVKGLTHSPIKGGKGNIEFLIILKYTPNNVENDKSLQFKEVVENAHNEL